MITNKFMDRRLIRTRSAAWAQRSARYLADRSVSANAISIAGLVFAIAGAVLLAEGTTMATFLSAAICIQLRLAMNMLDGLVAVENNRQTPTGELYNEIPDRIADVALLAAAGYACGDGNLGWLAANLALGTAYIRALGARRGWAQDFGGPQAKPQRMFILTIGCILAAAERLAGNEAHSLFIALIVIAAGSALTCGLRARRLAKNMGAA